MCIHKGIHIPPFNSLEKRELFYIEMGNRKFDKKHLVNAIISFVVAVGGYLVYKLLNPSPTDLFVPVIFFLILIYLELIDKR